MRVYLAGSGLINTWLKNNFTDFYRLQTFYHISENEVPYIKKYKGFLLDSGAFSFFGGAKVNWDDYVDKYINFINQHDVEFFFELDIYKLIGIKNTEKLRDKIEKNTNKKSIPVFHNELGVDYYKKLCDEYNYIAIGASGMHGTKWTRQNPQKLIALVNYAKNKNCKVHGLGYTKINMLSKIPFYSVDSTSWLSGNRFGSIYRFNGNGFDKTNKPKGKRVKTKETATNNFYEWVKFQKYAEKNL